LPRVDTLFLLSRLLIFAGIAWVVLYAGLGGPNTTGLAILTGSYLITMVIMGKLIRDERRNLKKGYLAIIIFDLIFVTVLINHDAGYHSDFFLMYYLTIMFAAYLLTFPATLILMGLTTIAYSAVIFSDIRLEHSVYIAIRIGLMWFLAMAISFVSDYVRRSEKRLLKLLDTLNQRTTELEKSQAHVKMIYDQSRILGGTLNVDELVEGVMKIMGHLLGYSASGIILVGQGRNFIYRGRNINGKDNFHLKAVNEEKNGLLWKVAKQTDPVSVVDVRGRDDYEPLSPNTRSVLLLPMVAHGKTNGIILAESPYKGDFSERDNELISIVARSASMALENAMLHKKMQELTITDELTGIYNYRYFARKLKEELRRAARYNLPLSMIMLDIDWFKKFNDTYGHEVGNIVLKGITSVVKKCIRDVDIFARYGGEEFVIILPNTSQDEVSTIGERIREQIEAATFGGGNIPDLKVTVSVGVSSFPENNRPYDELLSIVDKALYRAKGSGKNNVCVM